MNVLVTGAGGFVASHLVERLGSAGHQVRAFVRYNSRGDLGYLREIPEQLADRVEPRFGDLRDADAVDQALEGVDLVFHLGALISIPYSYAHPREVVETNVTGTLNVLMAARKREGVRIVHTSTSEVYGTAERVPMDERHPLRGQSPYSASKIGADKLVESFVDSYGIEAVTVRPFNTYGPRQSTRAVIPTIISQALTNDHVYLGNLSPTRDFTYVADTVDGFVRAASVDGAVGETINLGSGEEISIGELAELIIGLVDRNVEIRSEEARKRPEDSEVFRLHADTTKARELLGWEPQTGFKEGLSHTIEWIREHAAQYQTPPSFV